MQEYRTTYTAQLESLHALAAEAKTDYRHLLRVIAGDIPASRLLIDTVTLRLVHAHERVHTILSKLCAREQVLLAACGLAVPRPTCTQPLPHIATVWDAARVTVAEAQLSRDCFGNPSAVCRVECGKKPMPTAMAVTYLAHVQRNLIHVETCARAIAPYRRCAEVDADTCRLDASPLS